MHCLITSLWGQFMKTFTGVHCNLQVWLLFPYFKTKASVGNYTCKSFNKLTHGVAVYVAISSGYLKTVFCNISLWRRKNGLEFSID